MLKKLLFSIALVAPFHVSAGVVEELSINNVHAVFAEDDGFLEGYVPEEEAAYFQQITRSEDPFLVRFTLVKRYEQEGCGRVQIDMRQTNVPTKDMQFVTFDFPPVQLNICDDGEAPLMTPEINDFTDEEKLKAQQSLLDQASDM